jgi:hypothetical protein
MTRRQNLNVARKFFVADMSHQKTSFDERRDVVVFGVPGGDVVEICANAGVIVHPGPNVIKLYTAII